MMTPESATSSSLTTPHTTCSGSDPVVPAQDNIISIVGSSIFPACSSWRSSGVSQSDDENVWSLSSLCGCSPGSSCSSC